LVEGSGAVVELGLFSLVEGEALVAEPDVGAAAAHFGLFEA